MKIKKGATRTVLLTKRWAFKFPRTTKTFYHPRFYYILRGMIANMDEVRWYQELPNEKLCPIKFYIPGGFLVVMPRVEEFTKKEWNKFNAFKFVDMGDYTLPVELKADSFGKLNGKIVAIDYGNYGG